ncbi:MAG: ABC transporter ATP-binding protein [Verrucomicrobia bacterium]|jgi:putative ABC transport system ATP-binding protein|nr:ABC transporter ATP-binding protein [Verrucomicrobiota bacterium]MBT7068218.1 ABC transporter ATP-binding protein [Verrucomicrobiota bacterium]MBT7699035.1 ABC transporter ATP-binding protein [Verrucomicrobiota bacterium]
MPFDAKTYATDKEVVVRAVGVQKHFTRGTETVKALRGIDLCIYRGEYVCVMGPSGSGKSTFFNMVGGLDSPTSGRVFMDAVDMAQLNANELAFLRCRKVGYVFQSYNLNSVMTALDNVTLPMVFAGKHSDDARERGMQLLERVGLGERWNHRPKEMSGGQQQRVAIARSLANAPSLLLCDEPTANLDIKTGKEIHHLLDTLNKEDGVTIICATHDYNMLAVCDRIVWIADGNVDRIELSEDLEITKASLGEEHE